MAMPLSIRQYEEEAKKRNLELLDFAPLSVTTPVRWRCKLCGKIMEKSYAAFYYTETGCRCQSKNRFGEQKYNKLAEDLGIRWVGDKVPLNVYEETEWIGPSKARVKATYYQLHYGKVKRIYRELGILDVTK